MGFLFKKNTPSMGEVGEFLGGIVLVEDVSCRRR
jgi:hypothetical protein